MEKTYKAPVKRSFSFTKNYYPGMEFEDTEEEIRQQVAMGNVELPSELKEPQPPKQDPSKDPQEPVKFPPGTKTK